MGTQMGDLSMIVGFNFFSYLDICQVICITENVVAMFEFDLDEKIRSIHAKKYLRLTIL